MRKRLIASLLLVAAPAARAQTYTVVELDPTHAFISMSPVRIDEGGGVVGNLKKLGTGGATVLYGMAINSGVTNLLPVYPGDTYVQAYDRSTNGDSVGITIKPGSPQSYSLLRAVRWHLNIPVDLNTQVTGGAVFALKAATGIDSTGRIVGSGLNAAGIQRGYVFTQGNLVELASPLGAIGWSLADKIDDYGHISGCSGVTGTGADYFHATYWPAPGAAPVELHDPATIHGKSSYASAVDRFGRVAGWAEFAVTATGAHDAALWSSGTVTKYAAPFSLNSEVLGMNDLGTMVGLETTQTGQYPNLSTDTCTALIWRNGQMVTLDSLTTLPLGSTIAVANDISNDGRIVGLMRVPSSSVARAVMLLPQCAGSFTNGGFGCAGASGVPVLAGVNCPTAGNTFGITIANGRPGALAMLFVGAGTGALPLVPTCALHIAPLFNVFVSLGLDNAGAMFLPVPIPAGTASGLVKLQGVVVDPTANGGVSATNVLGIQVQ